MEHLVYVEVLFLQKLFFGEQFLIHVCYLIVTSLTLYNTRSCSYIIMFIIVVRQVLYPVIVTTTAKHGLALSSAGGF